MLLLGIDIGGTSVKGLLANGFAKAGDMPQPNGGLLVSLATGRSAPYRWPSPTQLSDAVAEVIAQLQEQSAVGASPTSRSFTEQLAAGTVRLGLCAPGLIDPQSGAVSRCINIPAMEGANILAVVREGICRGLAPASKVDAANLILPHTLVSDALATAIDWHHQHPTEQQGRTVCIVLGTGVGAAVLDAGVPVVITGRSAGHVGQMDVTLDDGSPAPIGPDGGAGSLEAYIGLPALLARYGPNLRSAVTDWTGSEPPIRALVRSIRIVTAMYRPQRIVLLGGVAILLAQHLPVIDAAVRTNLTSLAQPGWKLLMADDDLHAARGAARAARSAWPG